MGPPATRSPHVCRVPRRRNTLFSTPATRAQKKVSIPALKPDSFHSASVLPLVGAVAPRCLSAAPTRSTTFASDECPCAGLTCGGAIAPGGRNEIPKPPANPRRRRGPPPGRLWRRAGRVHHFSRPQPITFCRTLAWAAGPPGAPREPSEAPFRDFVPASG